jgi:cytochrome oxidase assembly protein ShyY1
MHSHRFFSNSGLVRRLRSYRYHSSPAAGAAAAAAGGKKKKDVLGMAVFSTICLSTMGLGIWQVKRYFWKVDLIETIKHASHAAPVVLDAARMRSSSTMNDLEGKVALVTGRFDHNNEIYLGPRSAPTSLLGYAAQGMATNPQGIM